VLSKSLSVASIAVVISFPLSLRAGDPYEMMHEEEGGLMSYMFRGANGPRVPVGVPVGTRVTIWHNPWPESLPIRYVAPNGTGLAVHTFAFLHEDPSNPRLITGLIEKTAAPGAPNAAGWHIRRPNMYGNESLPIRERFYHQRFDYHYNRLPQFGGPKERTLVRGGEGWINKTATVNSLYGSGDENCTGTLFEVIDGRKAAIKGNAITYRLRKTGVTQGIVDLLSDVNTIRTGIVDLLSDVRTFRTGAGASAVNAESCGSVSFGGSPRDNLTNTGRYSGSGRRLAMGRPAPPIYGTTSGVKSTGATAVKAGAMTPPYMFGQVDDPGASFAALNFVQSPAGQKLLGTADRPRETPAEGLRKEEAARSRLPGWMRWIFGINDDGSLAN
jgi:hypothetical protein